MQIIHCCLKEIYEQQKESGYYGEECVKKEGFLHFSTWNSFRLIASSWMNELEYVLLVVETTQLKTPIKWENDEKGHCFPHVYGKIHIDDIVASIPFEYDGNRWIPPMGCKHVLMNTSMIDGAWCYPVLRKLIKSSDEVCVLAFSFYEDTKNLQDWNRQYKEGQGIWYRSNTDVFYRYGIKKEQVHWVNYFSDSKVEMENKIMNSSIVLLTGGAPDLMMKRIKEFRLTPYLKNYQGLMIGYSAGAMIQLDEYHITPDEDYPTFVYERGLGCLSGFAIEPHYHQSKIQKESIRRVQEEKGKTVYGMYEDGGMIVGKEIEQLFGKIDVIENE